MKILIIRVSAIGDVIHTLPAVFLLKSHSPQMQISWVVQKKAADLLKRQPFLHNVWILADRFLMPQHLGETLTTLKMIRSHTWDAIIDFQGLLKTSLLLLTLRGKKYGFDSANARESASSLFTHHQVAPIYRNIIQKNLALASLVLHDIDHVKACPTIGSLNKKFSLHIPNSNKRTVTDWLASLKKKTVHKIIALSPNTTWQSKRWPINHWLKLLSMLPADYVVVLIGKDFGHDAALIADYAAKNNLSLDILPAWDLLTTTYFIQQSTVLIAPDTSFLHIADFLGVPAVGIFGPTSKEMHGPFLHAQNHAHALQAPCPHRYQKTHGQIRNNQALNCMENLTPLMVLKHVMDIVSKNHRYHLD